MVITAIQCRLGIFDKWKILISHESDRKDFQVELNDLNVIAYREGIQKGLQDAEETARKKESNAKLPLERKPNQSGD